MSDFITAPTKITNSRPSHGMRGLQVQAALGRGGVLLSLHNGGQSNMCSVLSSEKAIELAVELIRVARRDP